MSLLESLLVVCAYGAAFQLATVAFSEGLWWLLRWLMGMA